MCELAPHCCITQAIFCPPECADCISDASVCHVRGGSYGARSRQDCSVLEVLITVLNSHMCIACAGAGSWRWKHKFCVHCEGPKGCLVSQAGPALCAHSQALAVDPGMLPFLPIVGTSCPRLRHPLTRPGLVKRPPLLLVARTRLPISRTLTLSVMVCLSSPSMCCLCNPPCHATCTL